MEEKGDNFKFNNIDEVVKFESLLKSYLKLRAPQATLHISLKKCYEKFFAKNESTFYVLFDLFINNALLQCDGNISGGLWNENFSRKNHNQKDLLDSESNFIAKMDIHRFNTSYIFRYRALWDKIMGVLILTQSSKKNYDSFMKTKRSRRSKFVSIAKEIQSIPEDLIKSIDKNLAEFDNKFRTPEAHKVGRLRKYSFLVKENPSNPELELMGYANYLNEIIIKLVKLINVQNTESLNS